MNQQDSGIFGEEQNTTTIREQLAKYLAKWPLFLICMLFCVGAGYVYTRYAVPQYVATTSFLINGAESGQSNSSSNDLIEEALNGKREVNINNEILLIGSSNLMERTVAKNGFNISYFIKGRLLNTDIFKDAPFTFMATRLTDSNRTYSLYLNSLNANGGSFLYGSEKAEKKYTFQWNVPFKISGQSFMLAVKKPVSVGGEYIVKWQPIKETSDNLLKVLNIKPFDVKTSVIQLSIKTENLQKGKDVLNALFAEFNLSDIEERNNLSASTVQFINDRLVNISRELKGVEGNLENYQGSNEIVDIKGQSAQSLENSNDVSKTIKDLGIQQGVVSMILGYFSNSVNSNKLVPSSLGLNDGTLSSLITQYNELQLKKQREAPLVAPNSTVMQDLNTQLGNLKSSMLESLNNISKNLRLQETNFKQQNSQYRSTLSSIPHNERVLQEIKRKQSITEGLYLYLLQKREEAAISSTTSNVPHYKQIDSATGYGPVEPNTTNIIVYAALLGFFVAFGGIYFRNLLDDKITSTEDIVKRTSLPLLGHITHKFGKNKEVISVLDRNAIGEQFRGIRTNLYFLLRDKSKKVIMITSSVSNEGKSFISLNLAAVCAIPGKKVAMLEFDTRKPVIDNNLQLDNTKGLTDYLTGKVNSISKIFHVLDQVPSLHIFPAGPITLNPADLLLTENMSKLFEALKAQYDYIIIDSPPASLVSDPFILGEYSDIVLYIVRYKKTSRKHLDFINEVVSNGRLSNVTLILNDLKLNKSNYGYGSDYNYGN